MSLLTISEFRNRDGAPQAPPVAEQAVEIGLEPKRSQPFGQPTRKIRIHAEDSCCIAFGTATMPTDATPGLHKMAAGETRDYGVDPGGFLSVIASE